jgi:hypothetical protein
VIDRRVRQSFDVALVGPTAPTQNSEIEHLRASQFVSSPNVDIGRSQMVQFVEILGRKG